MWNPFARSSKQSVTDTTATDMAKVADVAVAAALDAVRTAGGMDGGLQNFVAGLNTDRDKRFYSQYCSSMGENQKLLVDNAFRGSWLARRIVTTIAEDMTRAGWKTSWDGAEKNLDEPKKLAALEEAMEIAQKLDDGISWGRQYGGAGLIIGINGQEKEMSQPLVLESIKEGSLAYIHAFDRWDLTQIGGLLENDMKSRWYGQPTHFQITNATDMVPNIHRSRVILFDGTRLSRRSWRENGYWHDSVLVSAMESVKNYDTATGGIASLIFEANVDIMTIPGLAELLATDKGRAKLMQRFVTSSMMKSLNRVLLIDGGQIGAQSPTPEKFDQKVAQFSGMNESIRSFMNDVAGAADVPLTRLFGESAGGLGATGEAEETNYYDHIAARQKRSLKPQLMYLYEILTRSAFGRMPKNFALTFNSLWQMPDTDKATVENARADRDGKYIDMAVLTPAAVAKQLKQDNVYSTMEDSDVKLAEEMHDLQLEQEQAAIENAAKAAAAKQAPPAAPVAGKGTPPVPAAA